MKIIADLAACDQIKLIILLLNTPDCGSTAKRFQKPQNVGPALPADSAEKPQETLGGK